MSPCGESQAEKIPPTGDPACLQLMTSDTVGCLSHVHRIYGDFVTFYHDNRPFVIAIGPEYNRAVFGDPDTFHIAGGMPGPRNSSQRRFSHGLFSTNGTRHQRDRRYLMPPFRKAGLRTYFPQMVALTERIISHWQPGKTIDLVGDMKELALFLTGNILFGLDEFPDGHVIAEEFDEWMESFFAVYFSTHLPIEIGDSPYRQALRAAERLDSLFSSVIESKLSGGIAEKHDVLALLLKGEQQKLFNRDEVIGQMHTVINAAYHTTASALTWSLFLLAQHPSVAQKLMREVQNAFGDNSLRQTHLEELPVLDRILKESMRVLPSVVFAPRWVTTDTSLGQCRMPRGSVVLLSIYMTHHLPELYENPERFRPDRWLNQDSDPYAYIPFGAGARMCIGASFAILMLKTALAMITQRFRLNVVPGTEVNRSASLTLGVLGEIPMTISEQDGRFSSSPVSGNIHDMVDLSADEAFSLYDAA